MGKWSHSYRAIKADAALGRSPPSAAGRSLPPLKASGPSSEALQFIKSVMNPHYIQLTACQRGLESTSRSHNMLNGVSNISTTSRQYWPVACSTFQTVTSAQKKCMILSEYYKHLRLSVASAFKPHCLYRCLHCCTGQTSGMVMIFWCTFKKNKPPVCKQPFNAL